MRDQTDAAIAAHVSDVEEINEKWRRREMSDVIPLIESTLDEIEEALAAGAE